MPLVIAIGVGVVISFALAYQGLFGGGLQFSKTSRITDRPAKIIGAMCGLFGLALIGLVIWAIVYASKQ